MSERDTNFVRRMLNDGVMDLVLNQLPRQVRECVSVRLQGDPWAFKQVVVVQHLKTKQQWETELQPGGKVSNEFISLLCVSV